MPWERQFDIHEVLNKAVATFWRKGYTATSIQDLVEATGLNRASLYATYGDKRSMFIAALRKYDENFRTSVLVSIERRYSPREGIGQLFANFISAIPERGISNGCFVTNVALELSAHDVEIRTIVANTQRETERFFIRMIEAGKQTGEIPVHVDTAIASTGLLASLLGLAVLVRSRPDPELLSGIVEDTFRRLQ